MTAQTRIPSPIDPRGVPESVRFGRRQLIVGALASGLLVACSNSGNDDDAVSGLASDWVDGDNFTLFQLFPQGLQVPGELRLPMSLPPGRLR